MNEDSTFDFQEPEYNFYDSDPYESDIGILFEEAEYNPYDF